MSLITWGDILEKDVEEALREINKVKPW